MQLGWFNEACNAVWLKHQVFNWTSMAQFKSTFPLDAGVNNDFCNAFFFFFLVNLALKRCDSSAQPRQEYYPQKTNNAIVLVTHSEMNLVASF